MVMMVMMVIDDGDGDGDEVDGDGDEIDDVCGWLMVGDDAEFGKVPSAVGVVYVWRLF